RRHGRAVRARDRRPRRDPRPGGGRGPGLRRPGGARRPQRHRPPRGGGGDRPAARGAGAHRRRRGPGRAAARRVEEPVPGRRAARRRRRPRGGGAPAGRAPGHARGRRPCPHGPTGQPRGAPGPGRPRHRQQRHARRPRPPGRRGLGLDRGAQVPAVCRAMRSRRPRPGGRRSASDRTGLASPQVAETRTRWRTVDPLRPGDPREVAGFHVVGRLGAGGMGVVYLADHPEHGPAALKFVRAGGPAVADPAFRARFGREVEAARRVRSPRVARVLAADPDATGPWLATAFVDGPTLQEAVEAEGPMSGDRLVALAVALADALAAVHEAGVVHRDLKPRNILLTPETPVLIDFGIASVREAPQLTRAGAALGTPGWMAPEQARGQRCGPATDVFAWGAVLAFAAGGRAPFGEGSADVLLYRIVHEPPDVPPLPPALDGLVRAALEKDPDRRPTVGQIL